MSSFLQQREKILGLITEAGFDSQVVIQSISAKSLQIGTESGYLGLSVTQIQDPLGGGYGFCVQVGQVTGSYGPEITLFIEKLAMLHGTPFVQVKFRYFAPEQEVMNGTRPGWFYLGQFAYAKNEWWFAYTSHKDNEWESRQLNVEPAMALAELTSLARIVIRDEILRGQELLEAVEAAIIEGVEAR